MQFHRPSMSPTLGWNSSSLSSSSSSFSSSLLPVSHLSSALISAISADVIGANFPLKTPFTTSASSPASALSLRSSTKKKKKENPDQPTSFSSSSSPPASSYRPLLYADFAATGRGLYRVEKFVEDLVLPLYGNTHTQESATGRHAAHLLEESRHILRMYMNADHRYALIFCGNGASGAVTKFLQILLLSSPAYAAKFVQLKNSDKPRGRQAKQSHLSPLGLGPSQAPRSSSSSSSPSSPSYLASFFSLFEEDRWGSYLCRECGSRLKTAAHARRHMTFFHPHFLPFSPSSNPPPCSSSTNACQTKAEAPGSSSLSIDAEQIGASQGEARGDSSRRVHLHIEFLVDPTCHHSSFLPFKELASSPSSSSSSSCSCSSASTSGSSSTSMRPRPDAPPRRGEGASGPQLGFFLRREEADEEEERNLFSYGEEAEKAGVWTGECGGAAWSSEERRNERGQKNCIDEEEEEEKVLERKKKAIKIRTENVDVSFGFDFLHLDAKTGLLAPRSLHNRLQSLHRQIGLFNRLEAKQSRSRRLETQRARESRQPASQSTTSPAGIFPSLSSSSTLSSRDEQTAASTSAEAPGCSSPSCSSSRSSSTLHLLLPVCIFSAASNVTGLISPCPSSSFSSLSSMSIASVCALNRLVHRFGGVACWDYAGASSHLPINVNCQDEDEGKRRQVDFSFNEELQGQEFQERRQEDCGGKADCPGGSFLSSSSCGVEEEACSVGASARSRARGSREDRFPNSRQSELECACCEIFGPDGEVDRLSASSSSSGSWSAGSGGCIDVLFFSPHKLLGGPGSSGVLVMKKKFLLSDTPAHPGGGTVYLVSGYKAAVYELDRSENREEAGSPNLLSIVRAGASVRLLQQLPLDELRLREERLTSKLLHHLTRHERIQIVGPLQPRVGIISLLIRYGNCTADPSVSLCSSSPSPSSAENSRASSSSSSSSSVRANLAAQGGLYLHHNFVTALLNDLFGIQVRGGCLCASPYTSFLLSIHPKLLECLEAVLLTTGQDLFRPGVVRLSLHGLMREEEVDKLLSALLWVASNGWKLMSKYEVTVETGEWKVRGWTGRREEETRVWISNFSFLPSPAEVDHLQKEKADDEDLGKSFPQQERLSLPSRQPLHALPSSLEAAVPEGEEQSETKHKQNGKRAEVESAEEMLAFADAVLSSHLESFRPSSSSPAFHLLHLPPPSCFEGYQLRDVNPNLLSSLSSKTESRRHGSGPDEDEKTDLEDASSQTGSDETEKLEKKKKRKLKESDGLSFSSSSASSVDLEKMMSSLVWFALPADASFSLARWFSSKEKKRGAGENKQFLTRDLGEERRGECLTDCAEVGESRSPASSSRLLRLYHRDDGLEPCLSEEAIRWIDSSGKTGRERDTLRVDISRGKKERGEDKEAAEEGRPLERKTGESKQDEEEEEENSVFRWRKRVENACFQARRFTAERRERTEDGVHDEEKELFLQEFLSSSTKTKKADDAEGGVDRQGGGEKKSRERQRAQQRDFSGREEEEEERKAEAEEQEDGKEERERKRNGTGGGGGDVCQQVSDDVIESMERHLLDGKERKEQKTSNLSASSSFSSASSSCSSSSKSSSCVLSTQEPHPQEKKGQQRGEEKLHPASKPSAPSTASSMSLASSSSCSPLAFASSFSSSSTKTRSTTDERVSAEKELVLNAASSSSSTPMTERPEFSGDKKLASSPGQKHLPCEGGSPRAIELENRRDDADVIYKLRLENEVLREALRAATFSDQGGAVSGRKKKKKREDPRDDARLTNGDRVLGDCHSANSVHLEGNRKETAPPWTTGNGMDSSSSTLSSAASSSPGSSSLPSRVDGACRNFLQIPRGLRRTVGEAIREFGMIKNEDRLLVGVSGGKDSLTLLHILRDLQRRAPIRFDLAAATVDPVTPEFNPKPLIPYMKTLGVKYHYLRLPIMALAKTHMSQRQSICAFCSRLKRGLLYSCMRKHGYNVLVLGQHLDDICESFLMSAFHNGTLNTMKAHYVIRKGDLRVCRPLIMTRERETAAFASSAHLPVIADNCPACFAAPKERHRMKLLLSEQETEFPHLFQNLLKCVKPLISISAAEALEEEEEDDEESKRGEGGGGRRSIPLSRFHVETEKDLSSPTSSPAQTGIPLHEKGDAEEGRGTREPDSEGGQENSSSQLIEENFRPDGKTFESLLQQAGGRRDLRALLRDSKGQSPDAPGEAWGGEEDDHGKEGEEEVGDDAADLRGNSSVAEHSTHQYGEDTARTNVASEGQRKEGKKKERKAEKDKFVDADDEAAELVMTACGGRNGSCWQRGGRH